MTVFFMHIHDTMRKHLRTIKKASAETGASIGFLQQLLTEGLLTRYKIKSATYISMTEFESIAIPIKKIVAKMHASKG